MGEGCVGSRVTRSTTAGRVAGVLALVVLHRWRVGDRTLGAAGFLLEVAAFAVWLPMDIGLDTLWVGYGATELVAFAAWGAWTAWRGGDSRSAADTSRGAGS